MLFYKITVGGLANTKASKNLPKNSLLGVSLGFVDYFVWW
jgi:hypothetical protein